MPQGKIVLSSRKRLGLSGSIWGEEIFELSKLSPPACVELFKKHTRNITQDIIQLIDPKQTKVTIAMHKKFLAHRLFEILAGNP